ncbi:hypothetical protein CPB85DRAFT_948038 [Mucidula mucida]|nr:hypothetical protein CPB85DRAFT_948038 [Mucidula mucida]
MGSPERLGGKISLDDICNEGEMQAYCSAWVEREKVSVLLSRTLRPLYCSPVRLGCLAHNGRARDGQRTVMRGEEGCQEHCERRMRRNSTARIVSSLRECTPNEQFSSCCWSWRRSSLADSALASMLTFKNRSDERLQSLEAFIAFEGTSKFCPIY